MSDVNTNTNSRKEERKSRVLENIVHEYVSTAVPVSSKLVASRMGGSVSSATIRNIMSELEEEGYIEQPHTSAGRVPTHVGYRRYVNIIKDDLQLERARAERLAAEYVQRIGTIQDVIRRTSFLISRELRNAGVVMWPSIEDLHLEHLELIRLKAETVLAVLVTMTRAVKNYVVKLDKDIEKAELEKVANYINTNFQHMSIADISYQLKSSREVIPAAESALGIIDSIVKDNIEDEIYWEGLDYFMDEIGSMGINVARNMLHMFSEREDLIRLMRRELPYRGLKVYIGEENNCKRLNECSLVTCGYTLYGRTVGRIGVIGPTRMNYDKAMTTISCLSDLISMKLEEING